MKKVLTAWPLCMPCTSERLRDYASLCTGRKSQTGAEGSYDPPSVFSLDRSSYFWPADMRWMPSCLAAAPKRVILLHSFGRDFKPWSEYAKTIRTNWLGNLHGPWTSLSIRFNGPFRRRKPGGPFADYLRALYAKRPPDVIVSIGAPAAAFVQRYRHDLFATTPMVFTAVEQRRVQYSSLTPNDAVVAVHINYLRPSRISCECCRTPRM